MTYHDENRGQPKMMMYGEQRIQINGLVLRETQLGFGDIQSFDNFCVRFRSKRSNHGLSRKSI